MVKESDATRRELKHLEHKRAEISKDVGLIMECVTEDGDVYLERKGDQFDIFSQKESIYNKGTVRWPSVDEISELLTGIPAIRQRIEELEETRKGLGIDPRG